MPTATTTPRRPAYATAVEWAELVAEARGLYRLRRTTAVKVARVLGLTLPEARALLAPAARGAKGPCATPGCHRTRARAGGLCRACHELRKGEG